MGWDAILFDFEGGLVDLSMGPGRASRPYHDGRRGVPPARDRLGQSLLQAYQVARDAGVPVAVVSSSPVQPVARWFEEQGLPQPDVLVAYHDTVLHRPAPAPLLEALSRLGVAPSHAVLSLGASADAVRAALSAGVMPASAHETVPLSAPPALYLADARAVLKADLWYALAGDGLPQCTPVSLAADLGEYQLQLGGRLGDPAMAAMLRAGASGQWERRAAELAHTLVIHALGDQPGGALLTWLPGFVAGSDPLALLQQRLSEVCSVPCRRLLRLDQAAGVPLLDEGAFEPGSLDGRTLLVLAALRTSGAGMAAAARALRAAGAARVVGLVLAQEETGGAGSAASWGPLRLANDELRRQRSRPRDAESESESESS
ncbi:MAG: hypothetical protein DRQ55_05090 [Planctomycetota bacterium]|nr:MAG: hypothetical protein DRQ55_05090 [Planctomycetota bacterium]